MVPDVCHCSVQVLARNAGPLSVSRVYVPVTNTLISRGFDSKVPDGPAVWWDGWGWLRWRTWSWSEREGKSWAGTPPLNANQGLGVLRTEYLQLQLQVERSCRNVWKDLQLGHNIWSRLKSGNKTLTHSGYQRANLWAVLISVYCEILWVSC